MWQPSITPPGFVRLRCLGPTGSRLWLKALTPDILSDVSHRRVAQPEGSKRRSAVSNSAARVVKTTTCGTLEPSKCVDAAIPTRSPHPASARGTRRSPVGSTAPAQKSERTSPHEGSHIRSTGSRRKALRQSKQKRGANVMDNWRQRTAFVGFDWAGDHLQNELS